MESTFINGLQSDIRVELKMMGLNVVEQAMSLTMKIEAKLNELRPNRTIATFRYSRPHIKSSVSRNMNNSSIITLPLKYTNLIKGDKHFCTYWRRIQETIIGRITAKERARLVLLM